MRFRWLRLARDYMALAGGELLSKLAGFAAFAYLARTLAPERYGAVELAAALAMVGMLIVDFGLGPIGARAVTRSRASADALARTLPAARLALGLPALAFMLLGAGLLGEGREAQILIACFGLGLLAIPWTLNWLLQGLDATAWVAPAQTVRMGAFAIGVVVLVRRPEDLMRVGAVEITAAFAMAIYYWLASRRRVPSLLPRFAAQDIRNLLREAAPVGAGQLLWVLNQYLPTLGIALWLTSQDVAYYGAAHRVVVSIGSFVWLYFFNLYPTLVRATSAGQGLGTMLAPSFRALAWLGVGVALAGSMLAQPMAVLAYGNRFEATGPLFALLIWVFPLSLLSGHARFSLIAAGHQQLELRAQAWGLAVTAALSLALIPSWGALGAASSMVIATAVVWAVTQRYALRALGPLPALGPLLPPALAAAGTAAIAFAAATDPWLRGLLAATLFAGVAIAFEWRTLTALGSALTPGGDDAP